ncbi:MAG: hypothetical protein MI785_05315 [Kiloniellales bacterium]|nr:hypothetical protein [Kiloniellales bacterium]
MLEDAIEERLLKNEFVIKLRMELTVDKKMFQELCCILKELAVYWKEKHMIRKDVAEYLYGLAHVTRDIAERFRENDPDFYSEVFEMSIEIDALVLDALYSQHS